MGGAPPSPGALILDEVVADSTSGRAPPSDSWIVACTTSSHSTSSPVAA